MRSRVVYTRGIRCAVPGCAGWRRRRTRRPFARRRADFYRACVSPSAGRRAVRSSYDDARSHASQIADVTARRACRRGYRPEHEFVDQRLARQRSERWCTGSGGAPTATRRSVRRRPADKRVAGCRSRRHAARRTLPADGGDGSDLRDSDSRRQCGSFAHRLRPGATSVVHHVNIRMTRRRPARARRSGSGARLRRAAAAHGALSGRSLSRLDAGAGRAVTP
jgi:hypothetical protein